MKNYHDDLNQNHKISEGFYYDEHVDVINPKQGTVLDGKITSIRGNIYIILYTESKEEEQINIKDNLILKKWCPGRDFQRFNRLDIQDPSTKTWNEGIILNIEKDTLLVRYQLKKTNEINEDLLPKDSKRIAPAGRYTGKFFAANYSSEEINTKLFSKRKFYKTNQLQEVKFKEQMQRIHFTIKPVQGDGNCLFRAISDQIYGDEFQYEIMREKCMDYLLVERDFFAKFVDGDYDEYISMKRTDGVWGDDIELQALSELYDRPIEIYSHSIEPLKTFHENAATFNRVGNVQLQDQEQEQEEVNMIITNHYPIRLSYHGKAHYNSIIPHDDNITLFKQALQKTKPGVIEDYRISYSKSQQSKDKEITKSLLEISSITRKTNDGDGTEEKKNLGREHFIEKKDKCIDDILYENIINESNELVAKAPNNTNNNDDINQAIIQSELEEDDKKFLDSAIQLSLENSHTIEQIVNLSLKDNTHDNRGEGSYNNKDVDYYSIPAIQTALEFGFSLDDAIVAYSIYKDDSDMILQYLYSMKNYY